MTSTTTRATMLAMMASMMHSTLPSTIHAAISGDDFRDDDLNDARPLATAPTKKIAGDCAHDDSPEDAPGNDDDDDEEDDDDGVRRSVRDNDEDEGKVQHARLSRNPSTQKQHRFAKDPV